MIQLEKLYETARVHLVENGWDWVGFAAEFQTVMGAQFVLYRPSLEDGVLAWRSLDRMLATTNPELARLYVENRVFEQNEIADDSLNPLEPQRRSDTVPDEVFVQLPVVQEFFLPHGFFYMMGTAAILGDSSRLMLVLWRDRSSADFSDLEKQRVALFMRYLSVLIKPRETSFKSVSNDAVRSFGEKYRLTSAESLVLSALLDGKSLRDISQETGRTYGTVRWHVQNILEKCQVNTQKSLLREFYRLIKR